MQENMENSADKDIIQVAGNDITQTASRNINEHSDKRIEFVEKDFKRNSDASSEIASEVKLFSQKENITIQSGKEIIFNSDEKSNIF
jgi:type VI secretion system secreted protein VgrG